MKKSGMTLVAVLLATSTFMAFAQPPQGMGMGRGGGMEGRHQQLKEALHLTDQQEAQIQKFRLDLERKQAQVHSRIQLARLDMKEMYLSDKIDRSALEKSIKEVSDLQHQQKLNFVDFWFSVNGILKPEQQKVWKQHVGMMVNEMRHRFRGGMHPGRRGMMPSPPPDKGDDN